VETLREAGFAPRRSIAVAAFTNEEGVRYAPDMMGSLVHAGAMNIHEALATVGVDGSVLGDELARIG
jgi:N-carbamoyl-L-amino-acid hydrolase